MKWIRVKVGRVQPDDGTWHAWKERVATDCGRQCVYCAISESQNGGIDHFHIDHFRPKANPLFSKLENAIENLFLACAICNRFKGDDWPGEPKTDHSVAAYANPAEHDFNTLMSVDSNFLIGSEYVGPLYMIERLYLNRPQLIRERRLALAVETAMEAGKALRSLEIALGEGTCLRAFRILASALDSIVKAQQSAPYQVHEIRRPSARRGRASSRRGTDSPSRRSR